MHMGYLAAVNIHQLIKKSLSGTIPDFMELDEVPPMIGLAVGRKALSYWPGGGTTSGEDVMEAFFGQDLGFTSKCSTSLDNVSDSKLTWHLKFAGTISNWGRERKGGSQHGICPENS
jgi:hypothetical protein